MRSRGNWLPINPRPDPPTHAVSKTNEIANVQHACRLQRGAPVVHDSIGQLVSWSVGQLVGNSTSFFSEAIFRISSVIFMEQYFGPHMLQK